MGSENRPFAARRAGFAALLWLYPIATAAIQLRDESAAAWKAYVAVVEHRIATEMTSPRGYLGIDFDPDAPAKRHLIAGGAMVVDKLEAVDARGETLTVPSARVHQWRGDVLIPGVTVAQLMSDLQAGVLPPQDDVIESRVLERQGNRLKVFLRLQRKAIITVVYDTEHVMTFDFHGASRASGASVATKIAEVSHPDTPDERELAPGADRGFLWHLNAYWRYEDVDGGVIAECESIALSRDAPVLMRYFVEPIVERAARESMTRTLAALKARFGRSTSA